MIADLVAIVLFATLGRSSHAESLSVVGVARVAAPFVAGWLVGALLVRGWRHPTALRTGLSGWLGALVGGMLLRLAIGAGVQVSFVVVAGVVLGVLLLGWRVVWAVVRQSRRASDRAAHRHRVDAER